MIVVFDAKCLLCSGWVQFLLRHDLDVLPSLKEGDSHSWKATSGLGQA